MAVLPDNDRKDVWADFMRRLSSELDPIAGLTKAELRAAVDALDDFMHANAGAVNNAIPQPARGALTTPQKARLLNFVVAKRYIQGA